MLSTKFKSEICQDLPWKQGYLKNIFNSNNAASNVIRLSC